MGQQALGIIARKRPNSALAKGMAQKGSAPQQAAATPAAPAATPQRPGMMARGQRLGGRYKS